MSTTPAKKAPAKAAPKPTAKPVEKTTPTQAAAASGDAPDAVEVSMPVDHDRVAMLSLQSNGRPSENNPEIISDRDQAVAATTEQLSAQAMSAVDSAAAQPASEVDDVSVMQDPQISEVQERHDDARAAAAQTAEQLVDGATGGDTSAPDQTAAADGSD